MKILHLSTWETGGAAIAATRLSNTLTELGETSEVLHMSSRIPAYIDAAIGKMAHFSNPIFHSYNYFGQNISAKIAEYKPDIIHIHWIGAGFIRPESLSKYHLPIVWTLHDLWPLCGAEHLPAVAGLPGSGRFTEGYLKNNRPSGETGLDLDRYVWERKLNSFKNLDLTYVAPSRYVHDMAKSAYSLGKHKLVYLPNGVDTQIFTPTPDLTRRPTILFVAMNPGLDPNKGYPDFCRAVALLPTHLRDSFQIKVIGGEVTKEQEMAKAYGSAVLTVVASKIENLPYVAMESMACGTPVVAYAVGGIPDLIDHELNGYLAIPADVKDLARGIEKLLNDQKLLLEYSRAARVKIIANFDLDQVAKKYLALYQSLI